MEDQSKFFNVIIDKTNQKLNSFQAQIIVLESQLQMANDERDAYKKQVEEFPAQNVSTADLDIIKNLANLNIWHLKVHYDVANDKLIYDRKLERGSGNTYYGLEVARAMNIPHDFLDLAISIRKTILKEDFKQSNYNKNISVHSCEVCGSSISNMLEVHHITPQKDSTNSILPNGQNKDHIRNLVVVCQSCHDKHHSNQIEIGSVKQTSNGLERDISEVKISVKRSKYTDEQKEVIQLYLVKYKNLSPKRIAYDLEKNEDIQISESSLRAFRLSSC